MKSIYFGVKHNNWFYANNVIFHFKIILNRLWKHVPIYLIVCLLIVTAVHAHVLLHCYFFDD